MKRSFRQRPFFIKLLNWEYWSFLAVYAWIYPIWFYFCLRARSFFWFAASNPSIEYGGFINESKKNIHPLIPEEFSPATVYFDLPVNPSAVMPQLYEQGLAFPLIGKPNKGGRGRGVKVLKTEQEVLEYAHNARLDFHIQEFVPFKNEVGIFYVRFPDQKKGTITGIVRKEFLSVTGDGQHTIREHLEKNSRAILQMNALEAMHGPLLDQVLPPGEHRVLVPYGNHARGAMFLDDTHLVDEELTHMIDTLCKRIPEFYYGRLDIRYLNWDDLKAGKNLSIIEVNGAGSEPTHIYDPQHSIFFAWREIVRHWNMLYKVSRLNHQRGYPYLGLQEGVAMFREDKLVSKKLAQMPA